jgi:hypothetical protein
MTLNLRVVIVQTWRADAISGPGGFVRVLSSGVAWMRADERQFYSQRRRSSLVICGWRFQWLPWLPWGWWS